MPSLPSYRRDLALKASSLKLVTAGVLFSGTYQGTASGSEAARRVVSSDLATVKLSGSAPELPATANDFQWTWRPSTSEQRRIVKNGYSGYNEAADVLTGQAGGADDDIVGYVTLDRALATTVAAAETIEILGRFPALGYEEAPGLHWAINEALAVMHGPRKESIVGDGTHRIDVSSSLPWAKRPEQLIRVFSPDANNGYGPQPMIGKAWLEPDGEKMWLHIPERVASGATFSAQFRRPYSTWIRTGGTWGASTVGLVNETDEALPEVDRVTAVAYWMLARRMARRGPKPQQDAWTKEAQEAAEEAAPFVEYPVEPPTPSRRMRLPYHPSGRAWRPASSGRRWP